MSITIEPTTFTVCGLDDDDNLDALVWSLTIEWRGHGDSWAVKHLSKCLSRDGRWDYEPQPSSRTEDWLAEHRFTFVEAKQMAIMAYPLLTVNGLRVEDGKLVPAHG